MEDGFHQLVAEIKPFLMPYLEEHGIEFDERNFTRCISQGHEDKTPSMHLVPDTDNKVLHCFGCGATYNIFHAARELEGKADCGTGFLTETLPYLAEKFGIAFDRDSLKLSEESLNRYRYQQLYGDAAAVLKDIGTYEHTTNRGWSSEVCREHGIATVDWGTFLTRLQNRGGYNEDEIRAKGIHPGLFGGTLITYTIRDWKGKVCGFVARNTRFDKNIRATHPKFRNTSDDVPIYNKSALLYGLEVAAKYPEKRLDIFEGYGDWVAAIAAGYRYCAAMGGVALTRTHLEILEEIGFTHINLIFDGDSTGQTKMEGYLDRYAGAIDGLRVTVMQLPFPEEIPPDERDPDTYFKTHSLKDYLQIQPKTAFDWRLHTRVESLKQKLLDAGHDKEELEDKSITWRLIRDDLRVMAHDMIPLIMAETSPMEQGRMCGALAQICGIKEEDVRAELSQRSNRQVNDISQSIQRKLKNARDSREVVEVLEKGNQQIERVTSKKDLSKFTASECVNDFDRFLNECDEGDDHTMGWRTGWRMWDDPIVLGGIPKKGSIITIAGSPNHGKSALLINLGKQLILPEQKNDGLSILLWYLDDPRYVAWSKMLASMCTYPILDIRRPGRSINQDPERKKHYDGWRDYLRSCVASKKLLVKGHEIGNDLESLQYWIKSTQDQTGNDVVVFVDAVHDMVTGRLGSDNDPRIRYMRIYDWVQATTEQDNYSFVTCAHITKSGMAKGKPEQSDLSETAKIIFSSKMIGMAYSELDYMTSIHRRDEAVMYWEDPDEHMFLDGKRPIVELNITKNKEAAFKGVMFFKHKSEACYMEPMEPEEVVRIKDRNQASRAEETSPSTITTPMGDITLHGFGGLSEHSPTLTAPFFSEDILPSSL